MGYVLKSIAILHAFLLMTAYVTFAGSQPPAEGGVLPDIVLTAPKSQLHQEYLGIAGKDTFRIPEINARAVIIEIFNMY